MPHDEFTGDRKTGRWLLAGWERRFVARHVGRIPSWIETHHLTLLTLPWGALAVAGGVLAARGSLAWLSLVSLAIALQYLTDLFDGAVGRHRDTGLVRWGFYMDHLLDYVFLCCVLTAWACVLPARALPLFVGLAGAAGALMASAFLAFAATGRFRISHAGVGPTELRLLLVAANQAIVALGAGWLPRALPIALGCAVAVLAAVAYRSGAELWALDLQSRARSVEEPKEPVRVARGGRVRCAQRGFRWRWR